jgi:hypothetical protein
MVIAFARSVARRGFRIGGLRTMGAGGWSAVIGIVTTQIGIGITTADIAVSRQRTTNHLVSERRGLVRAVFV